MTTYLLPLNLGEQKIERYLDQTYQRGATYLYGAHEDYTRLWYSEREQIVYKSTPTFGASLLTLNVSEDVHARLVEELELQSTEEAAQIYFSSDSHGKIRAILRLAACLSLNAATNPVEADYGHVWIDAMVPNNPPLMVAALEAARMLSKVESVRAVIESRREALLEDPTWSVLSQRVFEGWEYLSEPFFLPTRDVDRLLDRADVCIANGDFETALEALNTVVAENAYVLNGHIMRARILDQMGDHWGAWAAMSMGRLYTLAVSDDPDLSAMDAFIDLHRTKIETDDVQVTPFARQIGLSLQDTFGLIGKDLVLEFFADHDTEWRSKWLFLLDNYNPQLTELEPDSKVLQLFRGDTLFAEGKTEEALDAWMQFPEGQDFEAETFDSFAALAYSKTMLESTNLTSRFTQYINALLTASRWEEAIEFAQVWENVASHAIPLWVGRGIAETFSGRSEEAISSYSKAIELHRAEVDQVYFGEHPVSTAYFNRACELTKLGRIDDNLFEDLMMAVSLSPKFADEATSDGYLEGVFSDPRFEASIAAGLQQYNGEFEYEN